ncbi:MAG: DUF2309 family protein, partial [Deltaproteobacteria bacterium]|nr:DUF2309 family protein [Deltaproteobacteria bacterium]
MGKVKDSKHSVSERMGLHAAVRLASEAIAYYYPMTTFVHHNPLHGFEDMSFEDALKKGKDLFGAEGYLPEETYIDYLRCGRIKAEHLHQSLREAIERKGLSGYMKIGGKEITPFDVLKASFEHKVSEGAPAVEAGLSGRLFEHLAEAIEPYDVNEELERIVNNDVKGLGREMTISAWCDNVLKDDDEGITHKIDIELIKWCEAFLDEGHADWAMPGKDKGMYDAWRYVASKEISHHGIKDVAEKLKQLPAKAEDCMAECLSSLGVTEDMVQDYIRRHLVFLPGWAGYIKWCEDQEEHAWQQRYPAHLVDLMAIRLWYEKEFASIVCREKLGTDANIDQITEYMKGSSLDYFFRCEKSSALVPSFFSDEVDRIIFSGSNANTYWEELREGYFAKASSLRTRERLESYVKNTLILTESVGIAAEELLNSSAKDIIGAVEWMTSLDDSERGLVWLKAFEETYRESLIGKL